MNSIPIITEKEIRQIFRDEIKRALKDLAPSTNHVREWASAATIASMLEVSISTVKRLGDSGAITKTKIGGNVRYNIESARELAANNPDKYRPI